VHDTEHLTGGALTTQLTPHCKFFLETLIVPQMVNTVPRPICGTQKLIAMFIEVRNWTLTYTI